MPEMPMLCAPNADSPCLKCRYRNMHNPSMNPAQSMLPMPEMPISIWCFLVHLSREIKCVSLFRENSGRKVQFFQPYDRCKSAVRASDADRVCLKCRYCIPAFCRIASDSSFFDSQRQDRNKSSFKILKNAAGNPFGEQNRTMKRQNGRSSCGQLAAPV